MVERDEVGSDVRHWKLYYPAGRAGVGFLSTRIDVGHDISVELSPRVARLVAILRDARAADQDIVSPAAQGWRSKRDLAARVAEETGYTVDETSITAYLTRLVRDLRKASKDRNDALRGDWLAAGLIERQRGLGARLAAGVHVDIIDGNPRSASSEPSGQSDQASSVDYGDRDQRERS